MRAKIFQLILPALLMCGRAHAQETGGCADANPDVRIVACSALIQSGPGAASDFSIIFNNRGIGYAVKEEYDEAILDYNEAIFINPNFPLAYSNRGVAYEAKGEFARAIEDYSKAIALDPNFRPAFNNRCYALAELGRPTEALADCNKALTLQSGDARALDSRGFVYFRLGRYAEAIRDLDEALRLNPAMPTAFYVRGLAKLRAGDSTGRNDVDHAVALDKKVPEMMARIGVSPPAETSPGNVF
jgi:tetratricopeptide (TPR) repeat protein